MDPAKSKRLTQLPPFLYSEMRRRVKEAKERGVDVIDLGPGDPDRPTPEHVVEALARAARDPSNQRYSSTGSLGLLEYREAVSAWYRERHGVVLDPADEVLCLIGSKEANHHLALALLDPGSLALVPDPGYPAYGASVALAGARALSIPLSAEKDFRVDIDSLRDTEATDATAAWLNYPNNPTSAVVSLDFYRRAVDFAHEHEVLLISDNPYSEISLDGERIPSILEVDGAKDVAVELNSLSKTFNMAGWRLGMAVGNRTALAAMAQVKENTDTGQFMAVQRAGIAALEGPQQVIEENNGIYARRRDGVVSALREMGLEVASPKATFYLWLPVPGGLTSAAFSSRLLELAGVVVSPGAAYGDHGEGYVRLSLAVPDERLHEAMQRIQRVRDRLLASTGRAAHTAGLR